MTNKIQNNDFLLSLNPPGHRLGGPNLGLGLRTLEDTQRTARKWS